MFKTKKKESEHVCTQWKEGKGRGYKRFKNCSTCHFAGYGVCLHPYSFKEGFGYKKDLDNI